MEQGPTQVEIVSNKSLLTPVLISAIVTALLVGVCVYVWQQEVAKKQQFALEQQITQFKNQALTTPYPTTTPTPNVSDPVTPGVSTAPSNTSLQTLVDDKSRFSFQCPLDWEKGSNLDYNGMVKIVECSKIYSKIDFSDGVDVKFGFVSDSASNYEWSEEKWSDTLINSVKNEANATSYVNQMFKGWISMKNQQHTLTLIARMPVQGGYYEVSAEAEGDRMTDVEYKRMIDTVIASFKLTK